MIAIVGPRWSTDRPADVTRWQFPGRYGDVSVHRFRPTNSVSTLVFGPPVRPAPDLATGGERWRVESPRVFDRRNGTMGPGAPEPTSGGLTQKKPVPRSGIPRLSGWSSTRKPGPGSANRSNGDRKIHPTGTGGRSRTGSRAPARGLHRTDHPGTDRRSTPPPTTPARIDDQLPDRPPRPE